MQASLEEDEDEDFYKGHDEEDLKAESTKSGMP